MFVVDAMVLERDASFPETISYVRDPQNMLLRLPSLHTDIVELVHTAFAIFWWCHILVLLRPRGKARSVLY
jgi:hypothetical protein